ncbi:MAG: dTDP-glucose 4,6-dehydratase [Planctomycetota bacterium]|nr:dTDP-glucose 4,6-dehydratase [Planctomycetota bacterium]
MKQRVLITGGAGFIGTNLVRHMVSRGHEVLNVDCLTYAGNLNSLKDVESSANYAFSRVDIRHSEALHKVVSGFAPDWVMHLAAESHVDRSIDGPRQFVETNVLGTFNLLQVSLQYFRSKSNPSQSAFRFLHVSTDEVYGSLGATGLFTEDSRYMPHSPYAATKAASDHLARAWQDTYGLPVIVSNCSNNYGPYQFPEKLIPVVIMKCLRSEKIPVYGKGENVRDWLYVEDHCEALSLILEKGTPGETYNVGGNNEKRNIDLVRLICSILDELKPRPDGKCYSEQIMFVPDRPGHDWRYAIDATKVSEQLGWKPKNDDEAGFRKTVMWYLENQAWWQPFVSAQK